MDELRGHLGSELQRKSSAILSIERDKEPNVSVVKALKVRDGSPFEVPLMQFAWNKEARMHLYLGEKSKVDKEDRKREELKRIVAEIFAQSPPMPYNELMQKIVESSGVSERTAKSYIKYMRENELIVKDVYNDSLYLEGL